MCPSRGILLSLVLIAVCHFPSRVVLAQSSPIPVIKIDGQEATPTDTVTVTAFESVWLVSESYDDDEGGCCIVQTDWYLNVAHPSLARVLSRTPMANLSALTLRLQVRMFILAATQKLIFSKTVLNTTRFAERTMGPPTLTQSIGTLGPRNCLRQTKQRYTQTDCRRGR